MNLVFSYRECANAMRMDDWREIETYVDREVYAKGDARATLYMRTLSDKNGNDARNVVVVSEGVEFARLLDQPNKHGYCRLRAIPTQPGWIAHNPTPAQREAEAHAEY